MKKRNFIVLGGDKRNLELVNLLWGDGHNVRNLVGTDIQTIDLEDYEIIIGPLPFSHDNETINAPFHSQELFIEEIFKGMKDGQLFIAGKIEEEHILKAKDYKINIIDYFNREEMQVLNAIPTAEGAIQLAMEYLPITIHGSNALVLGFGRIGKVLANMLNGIGANVYVLARNYGDIAWIENYKYSPVLFKELSKYLLKVDVIFNTIPSIVLGEEMLVYLNKQSLIIDLASKIGGIDFNAAKGLGIDTIHALGLPGKYAPISAAKIIKETIYNIIEERGI